MRIYLFPCARILSRRFLFLLNEDADERQRRRHVATKDQGRLIIFTPGERRTHTRESRTINVGHARRFSWLTWCGFQRHCARSSVSLLFSYLIPHRECQTAPLRRPRRCRKRYRELRGRGRGASMGHFQYLLYFRQRRFHPLDIRRGVTLYAPRHYILIFQDSMIPSLTRPAVLNLTEKISR